MIRPALACLSLLLVLASPSPSLAGPAAPAAHVSDPTAILPSAPAAAAALESRLAAFEHATGIPIVVEFHAQSPSEAEDKIPGVYMRTLATKLGLAQRGVLAVYFADDPDWRLWIGDDLAAKFAGQPGTAAELTKNKGIHNAKEALFAAVQADADAVVAKPKSPAPSAPTPLPAARVVAEADALLTRLLARLGAP